MRKALGAIAVLVRPLYGLIMNENDNEIVVQTRSEKNGCAYFSSLGRALRHAEKDPTVWKVSFALANGERVRLVREQPDDKWKYDPI